MSDQTRERLSALLDGELERDELRFLIRRLEHDGASAECWSRYCIARQVLRRGPIAILSDDFRKATMARIAGEPVPAGGHRPWLRWASGAAIAASVALVALGIGNPSATRPGGSMAGEAAADAVAGRPSGSSIASASTPGAHVLPASAASPPIEFRPPLLAPSQPVVASTSRTGIALPGPVQVAPAAFDPNLRSYLIRHYEASGAGQVGLVPYALLVVPPPGNGADNSAEARATQH